jgi:hypothetical protein
MFAGSANSDDQKAVLAAEKQLATAMIKADAATIEKLLADDLSYTHSNAKTETKADVVQTAKAGSTKYESISYDTTTVRQYGDTVVTTHNMTIVVQPNTNKPLRGVSSGPNAPRAGSSFPVRRPCSVIDSILDK